METFKAGDCANDKRNCSEENKMNMYEVILSIIDQRGPATIPSICQLVNENPTFMKERMKPVQLSQVKSVISRKKDLFSLNNNVVSLLPDKELVSLTAEIGGAQSPWFKIRVDFKRKTFVFFEMNVDPKNQLLYVPTVAGSTEEFKKELYRIKIWNWESQYEPNGIVLDGTSWSITLKTKSKTYKSKGLKLFPKDWKKFCKALEKLTGKAIHM